MGAGNGKKLKITLMIFLGSYEARKAHALMAPRKKASPSRKTTVSKPRKKPAPKMQHTCKCRRTADTPGVMRNSDGRLVSAARSAASRNNSWAQAVKRARADLGVKGFVPIKRGSALYNRAKELQR